MISLPILILMAAIAQQGKADQPVSAYQIPFYGLFVIDLGTGGLSLVFAEEVGFVTDGSKIVTLRYGIMAKAQEKIPQLTAAQPHVTLDAKYWAKPNAVVFKGPHIATTVFDADNIATVDSGHFLAHCFQGTQATCSALISKVLAAGINLDPAPAVVGRGRAGHSLHHGRVPAHAHSWREVMQFLDR